MSATATAAPKTRGQLTQEYAQKQAACKALNDKGIDNLTADEAGQLTALLDERDAVKAQLDEFPKADAVKSRLDEGARLIGSGTHPVGHPPAREMETPGTDKPDTKGRTDAGESEMEKFLERGDFKSLGHFGHAIARAQHARPAWIRDEESFLGRWNSRVGKYIECGVAAAVKADMKAVASGLNELADSEGAALIPITFAQGIYARSLEQMNLMQFLNPIPVVGNTLSLNAYADDSRTDGNRDGGVLGYWEAEAAQYAKSKPSWRKVELKLHKLTLMVYVTQEMIDDSPIALDSEISRLASREFTFKCNNALYRGDTNNGSAGIPTGFLNYNAKITQGAVSGQGANTITASNIDQMWARRMASEQSGYIWLGNQDIEPQLAQLNYNLGSSSVAANWLYVPAGGITGLPNPQLKGRPLYFPEQAESLGTEGDLVLWNPAATACIVKSTGIQQSISMHLRFDYDETAFKFSYRMDAKCYWDKPLTRYKGANTLGPVVTLNSSRT